MKNATLCFLINKETEKILLGMKKRGFGKNKWNGFGGKVEDGENIKQAAIRELFEESGVKVKDAKKLAELTFFFKNKPKWNQVVHVFISNNWKGEAIESEEMLPKWFNFKDIPFEKMWRDDVHWLPFILKNKKVNGEFTFGEDNETIIDIKLKEIK